MIDFAHELVILIVKIFTNKLLRLTILVNNKTQIYKDYSLKERILKQANISLKTIWFLLGLLLFVGAIALAGCQSAEPDSANEAVQVADLEPVLVQTATAVTPTDEPPAEPTGEPVPIDNCLDCHTNKDLLIQTADPEEEVISENEGEG